MSTEDDAPGAGAVGRNDESGAGAPGEGPAEGRSQPFIPEERRRDLLRDMAASPVRRFSDVLAAGGGLKDLLDKPFVDKGMKEDIDDNKRFFDGTGKEATDGTGKEATDGTGKEATDGTGKEATDGTGKEATDGPGGGKLVVEDKGKEASDKGKEASDGGGGKPLDGPPIHEDLDAEGKVGRAGDEDTL